MSEASAWLRAVEAVASTVASLSPEQADLRAFHMQQLRRALRSERIKGEALRVLQDKLWSFCTSEELQDCLSAAFDEPTSAEEGIKSRQKMQNYERFPQFLPWEVWNSMLPEALDPRDRMRILMLWLYRSLDLRTPSEGTFAYVVACVATAGGPCEVLSTYRLHEMLCQSKEVWRGVVKGAKKKTPLHAEHLLELPLSEEEVPQEWAGGIRPTTQAYPYHMEELHRLADRVPLRRTHAAVATAQPTLGPAWPQEVAMYGRVFGGGHLPFVPTRVMEEPRLPGLMFFPRGESASAAGQIALPRSPHLALPAGVPEQRSPHVALPAGVPDQRSPRLALPAGVPDQMSPHLALPASVPDQMSPHLALPAGVEEGRPQHLGLPAAAAEDNTRRRVSIKSPPKTQAHAEAEMSAVPVPRVEVLTAAAFSAAPQSGSQESLGSKPEADKAVEEEAKSTAAKTEKAREDMQEALREQEREAKAKAKARAKAKAQAKAKSDASEQKKQELKRPAAAKDIGKAAAAQVKPKEVASKTSDMSMEEEPECAAMNGQLLAAAAGGAALLESETEAAANKKKRSHADGSEEPRPLKRPAAAARTKAPKPAPSPESSAPKAAAMDEVDTYPNVEFQAAVYGRCKTEHYSLKSYIRRFDPEARKWVQVIGSTHLQFHKKVCRLLQADVTLGKTREQLLQARQQYLQELESRAH